MITTVCSFAPSPTVVGGEAYGEAIPIWGNEVRTSLAPISLADSDRFQCFAETDLDLNVGALCMHCVICGNSGHSVGSHS